MKKEQGGKRRKKKKKPKCFLCGGAGPLKWKYERNKEQRICEACHLARQCLNEHEQGLPIGYWVSIKRELKECWNEITEGFWDA